MSKSREILIYGRRLHNAMKNAIEDGDGRVDDVWLKQERPAFEHYTCSMYLTGCLSYLEDKFGIKPWNKEGDISKEFNAYIQSSNVKSFIKLNISKSSCEALVCIRNSVVHNGGDLAKNTDKNSFMKVNDINIPNIKLDGTKITLLSTSYQSDFMEYVRQHLLAVSMYHGQG